jgi:uncharacterized protein (DUF934 family)
MQLLKDGRIIDDPFTRVADEAPIPNGTAVLLSASRFIADADAIAERTGPIGILWPNDRSVGELAHHLDRLALVALAFPNFRDGRAYSQARLLRERYGFPGELRATGEVLRDQFLFLVRAGFDAFEVKKDADAAAFVAAVRRYSVFYQPTGDRRIVASGARVHLPTPAQMT